MKTGTIHLGVLGMVLAALVALPASTALARDRDDDGDRGRPAVADRHDRDDHGSALRHDDKDGRWHVGVQFGRPSVERRWVPGHYETRIERVLVEDGHYVMRTERVLVEDGHWEDRCFAAQTETRRDRCGRLYTVIIVPARTERVWVPAVYETRTTRVWCPARYETREVRVWVAGYYATEKFTSPGIGIHIGR